jgi:amidase
LKKLTLSQQKKLCYVISAENKPVLYVDAGETVVVETEDAWSGQIRKDGDKRDKSAIPFSNPVSGPIHVNGASKGDSLVVSVEDI